jgi:hypothetical protein
MPRSNNVPAWKKAGNTDRWTEILFRALASRIAKRWRLVSFRGDGGGEWRGIVDVLAIRKDTSHSTHELLKSGDRRFGPDERWFRSDAKRNGNTTFDRRRETLSCQGHCSVRLETRRKLLFLQVN